MSAPHALTSVAPAMQAVIARAGAAQLDSMAKAICAENADGRLSDDNAQALLEAIAASRQRGRHNAPSPIRSRLRAFLPRRRPRSPDREASLRRKRTLGSSGSMPPALRAHFTEGQRAALTVIAGEVKHHGQCDLAIDRIAALAGVGRTTVQDAVHEAARLGLIAVQRRPRRGAKNLTNVVRIVAAEWLAWIKRGLAAHRPIGSEMPSSAKKTNATKITGKKKEEAFEKKMGNLRVPVEMASTVEHAFGLRQRLGRQQIRHPQR
ncbi:hypothetical protein [Ancylobacter terrae]|uniref:hypothetical protein n=1 Tax=Ancylobacter sp. sgz301288 TaxID=3342077 RepID=UPI00385CD402